MATPLGLFVQWQIAAAGHGLDPTGLSPIEVEFGCLAYPWPASGSA